MTTTMAAGKVLAAVLDPVVAVASAAVLDPVAVPALVAVPVLVAVPALVVAVDPAAQAMEVGLAEAERAATTGPAMSGTEMVILVWTMAATTAPN